jgi:hypothetical protein
MTLESNSYGIRDYSIVKIGWWEDDKATAVAITGKEALYKIICIIL